MKSSQIYIQLNENKVYTNRDIISGTATIVVEERLDISSIKVNFLGISRSRNYTYANNLKSDITRKHTLINLEAVVFPPKLVQEVSDSKSFTLTSGLYDYPFSFQIPDGTHNFKCVTDNSFFHSNHFTRKEPHTIFNLPPSFYLKEAYDRYARVDYSIRCLIERPSFFKFNLSNEAFLTFQPDNSALTYSVNHVSNKKILLGDNSFQMERVKFLKDESRQGTFSNWWNANYVKVPFELAVNYHSEITHQNEKGPTKRILECGHHLSKYISLTLKSEQSHEQLLSLLGEEKKEKQSREVKITLDYVKISLESLLKYYGAETREVRNEYILVDKPLQYEIKLSDFTPSYVEDITEKGRVHNSYTLNPRIFDSVIPILCQSFLTCTIKNNYNLIVKLSLKSSLNALKQTFKFKDPVIIVGNEPSPVNLPPPYVHNDSDSDSDEAPDEKHHFKHNKKLKRW